MEPADFEKTFPNITAKTNSQVRLLWIACGADDGLNSVNRQWPITIVRSGSPR